MEVHFTPEMEKRIKDFCAETGYSADDLVADAMAGFLEDLQQTREMLDGRYDDLESGRVKPIPGEEFFEGLRRREKELLEKQSAE